MRVFVVEGVNGEVSWLVRAFKCEAEADAFAHRANEYVSDSLRHAERAKDPYLARISAELSAHWDPNMQLRYGKPRYVVSAQIGRAHV